MNMMISYQELVRTFPRSIVMRQVGFDVLLSSTLMMVPARISRAENESNDALSFIILSFLRFQSFLSVAGTD
ncbi:hypothetical protein, partial [Citrobacter freundii]|uniref:hypothetical protein n=2 Tax=Citrobacter freundii TaxID=546 RepID=UPI0019552DB6